jgi:hypothetical protein
VDGSPSINSAALIPTVRDVSGCRMCIGFCFQSACLLFRFRLVPRPVGWGVDLVVLVSIVVVMGLSRSMFVEV